MNSGQLVSSFCQNQAQKRGILLVASTNETKQGERALWQKCVSWGVNPMPYKIIAISANTKEVIGASYYNAGGFLSALAVLHEWRGKRIGKLLIAATVEHMKSMGCINSSLHVLDCDASEARHGLYTSCGYLGGNARSGGTYYL